MGRIFLNNLLSSRSNSNLQQNSKRTIERKRTARTISKSADEEGERGKLGECKMTDNDKQAEQEKTLKDSFNKVLNAHGYGFQYSALEFIKESYHQGKTNWLFEAAEYPVEVQGKHTCIDFILKWKYLSLFLIAECKRVDPKFSNWCFIKAPYELRHRTYEKFVMDSLTFSKNPGVAISRRTLISPKTVWGEINPNTTFHIGVVLKNHSTGCESGRSENDAIENAASQVCRGLNGFMDLAAEKHPLSGDQLFFMPAIITTAKLWTSDSDISHSNILDGKIKLTDESLVERGWIYYQYHLSPGLKHSMKDLSTTEDSFSKILDQEYIRTILIISASGIEDFLTKFDPSIL